MNAMTVIPVEPDLLIFSRIFNRFANFNPATDVFNKREVLNQITEYMVELLSNEQRSAITGVKNFAYAINTLDTKFGFIVSQSFIKNKDDDFKALNDFVNKFDAHGSDFKYQKHIGTISFSDITLTSSFKAFIFVTPYEDTNNPEAVNYEVRRQIDKLENCIYLAHERKVP